MVLCNSRGVGHSHFPCADNPASMPENRILSTLLGTAAVLLFLYACISDIG